MPKKKTTPEGMSEQQNTQEPNKKTEGDSEESLIGTSAILFGDLTPTDEEATPPPVNELPKNDEETPPQSEQPEYLNIEEFGEKTIKAKIDGVEVEVPLTEAIKGYQTDRFLTQKGQKIAEEKRALESFKEEMLKMNIPSSNADIGETPEEDEYYTEHIKPYTEPLMKELKELKDSIAAITATTAPMQAERAFQEIDKEMKAEGLTDFLEKRPDVEKVIMSMPVGERERFSDRTGFIFVYKDLKLKEALRAQKTTSPDLRPAPNVIPIESGTIPTGASGDASAYATAFKTAKETGDWSEVLRLKGVL